LMALATTDVAMPHQVKLFTGLDPTSREFRERYGEQLRLLVRHLAPRHAGEPGPRSPEGFEP